MSDPSTDNGTFAFAAPRTVAEVHIRTGELRMIVEGARPFNRPVGLARLIIAAPSELESLAAGWTLDSSVRLSIPTTDIDSEETDDVAIGFYLDEHLRVVITGGVAISRRAIAEIAVGIADELPDEAFDDLRNVGDDARWIIVRILRGRIRQIEESVRNALADERISSQDYAALREYPTRLARVERLASSPEPQWQPAQPPGRFEIALPNRLRQSLRDVAVEAREAVARLSGLIASQSVVVTQRQAAETARFQRLLTLVGTTVLVPGLVAAVFGANVNFPGRDTLDGFWAMLCFMIASAGGAYALLRSFEQGLWSSLARRLRLRSEHDVLVFTTIALAATAGGVVILALN